MYSCGKSPPWLASLPRNPSSGHYPVQKKKKKDKTTHGSDFMWKLLSRGMIQWNAWLSEIYWCTLLFQLWTDEVVDTPNYWNRKKKRSCVRGCSRWKPPANRRHIRLIEPAHEKRGVMSFFWKLTFSAILRGLIVRSTAKKNRMKKFQHSTKLQLFKETTNCANWIDDSTSNRHISKPAAQHYPLFLVGRLNFFFLNACAEEAPQAKHSSECCLRFIGVPNDLIKSTRVLLGNVNQHKQPPVQSLLQFPMIFLKFESFFMEVQTCHRHFGLKFA